MENSKKVEPRPIGGEGKEILLSKSLKYLLKITKEHFELTMEGVPGTSKAGVTSSQKIECSETDTDSERGYATDTEIQKRKRKRVIDGEGFVRPRKTVKKIIPITPKETELNNRYDSLQNNEIEIDVENTNTLTPNIAIEIDRPNPTPNKQVKPPPIVITQKIDFIAVTKHIKTLIVDNMEVAYTTQGIRMNIKTLTDYKIAIKYLNDQKMEYYTYPTYLEKFPKVFLKAFSITAVLLR